jgi:hypothetical protein
MPLRAPKRHIPLRKQTKAATPADSYHTCTMISNLCLHLITIRPLWPMLLQLPGRSKGRTIEGDTDLVDTHTYINCKLEKYKIKFAKYDINHPCREYVQVHESQV